MYIIFRIQLIFIYIWKNASIAKLDPLKIVPKTLSIKMYEYIMQVVNSSHLK